MRSPQSIDFDGFKIAILKDAENQKKYPTLWALATAHPSLFLVQYLPSLHKWCGMILDK